MITHSHPPGSEPARTHSNQDPQADAGFSQIDLLTVIVVLALLALVLSPALARTQATDQTLQCRNNLRQLVHGWRLYAEDNNGILSLPYSYENRGYPWGTHRGVGAFDWVLDGYMSYDANNPANTNIDYLLQGPLGPYVRNPAVYKCPADQSQALEGGVKLPRVRTYSMSQAFSMSDEGHLEDADSPPNYWRHYSKTTDMVAPSPVNLWVMTDENPDSINDGAFAVAMTHNNPALDKWQDIPSTLHDGGCGFAFADGHYEIKKWTDLRTLAMKVTYTQITPSSYPIHYGMPQPNNNDIQWVKDRTTAPK
jgi:prepilin-type processing-associated H-X9-DG protein